MTTLRPYQAEAVEAVKHALGVGRATLLVMAMGLGKTVCAAAIAAWFRAQGRVLFIAHREELIRQAADKITRSTSLSVGVEMADERVSSLFMPDVVVASVQTLSRLERLRALPPAAFSLIIADECHHAKGATWRRIFDHFSSAKLLGLTATPDRADGVGMGQVFESVAYTLDIRSGIEQGYLAPIRQRMIQLEGLDLSAVRTTAGDLNEGDLEKAFVQEAQLHRVAAPLAELATDLPTLVFCTVVFPLKQDCVFRSNVNARIGTS